MEESPNVKKLKNFKKGLANLSKMLYTCFRCDIDSVEARGC